MRLRAAVVASGIALGPVALVGDGQAEPPSAGARAAGDPVREWSRVEEAFAATRRDLDAAVTRLDRELGSSVADVFRAHRLMLDNLLASDDLAAKVRELRADAAHAVHETVAAWTSRFQRLADPVFRQRADDVADLGRRVLAHLEGAEAGRFAHLAPGAIAAVRLLLPSDVIALVDRRVGAILVESIGLASHAALLAREKSIATLNVPDLRRHVRDGDEVFVDAFGGEILVGDDLGDRDELARRVAEHRARISRCRIRCHQAAKTRDGVLVRVEANLGTRADVDHVLGNGADGVGLFRTEQLYLGRALPPAEDELFEELESIASPLRDKPLTIRLLDAGGDKELPFLPVPRESNPSLGLRGVRLLLRYPALLSVQLAAILRLSRSQEVRVLVPMVTLEDDIAVTRGLFDDACHALGITTRPLLGAMIETPAAALGIAGIARHVDFLSVGTNDLTQYTFAAGRDDPNVNAYFQDAHPSLLRLLDIVLTDAGSVPVTLCGELAAREELLPRLLAIGFRALSVAAPRIPEIKDRIRQLSVAAV